ncbi:MAG: methyltransferase domain-containing protein [Legionellaceae bacterium]|nr:methyltransferase domain-containing protein [Legionellaceae bacterium]MBP9774369.1 methyltransferase domain-containing protein [Legionellaceae bacterium]
MNQRVRQTHLEYYREHQITPVHYDLNCMQSHLERRQALYQKLGLLPLTFRQSNVLEIAAGTGQNSLYIAQLMPKKFVLLEPNEVAVSHIKNTYEQFTHPHTQPQIVSTTLENYLPEESFDIVLCENWLGTSEHEKALLNKLSTFVAPQGLLVLTTVSPIGFVPNLLRRFLAIYLCGEQEDFLQKTETLSLAFASHLGTLSAMTRNITDWVQDNMLNPAYFGLCLSIPTVVERLKDRFDILGSSPGFITDWRWFKKVYGAERRFNEYFLTEYWQNAHNFLDYREPPKSDGSENNFELESKAFELLHMIAEHEDAHMDRKDLASYAQNVRWALNEFIELIPRSFIAAQSGLKELRHLIHSPETITVQSVQNMIYFQALFGRETAYISLIRG